MVPAGHRRYRLAGPQKHRSAAQLLCLAGAGLRRRARGTGAHPDRRAETSLRSALAAVQPAGAPGAGERAVPSGPLAAPGVSMEG
ncbi:hypothetical protein [Streptomyces sp. NBC_00984]|uniref:hypothetical protein n=1 Tax=Streptomyces sp. NBC_00984 TaxID=2903700 RepID=UPI003870E1F5